MSAGELQFLISKELIHGLSSADNVMSPEYREYNVWATYTITADRKTESGIWKAKDKIVKSHSAAMFSSLSQSLNFAF